MPETTFGFSDDTLRWAKTVLAATEAEEKKAFNMRLMGKTVQEFDDSLQQLKEWLEKQAHLPQKITDKRLAQFLFYSKMNLDNAKKKIDAYFTLPNFMPEFFANREPLDPYLERVFFRTPIVFVPKLTPDLGRVIFIKITEEYKPEHEQLEFWKYILLISDSKAIFETCCHEIAIADVGGMSFAMTMRQNPVYIKKAMMYFQKSYGARIKGFHFINCAPYFASFITLFKSVLSEKLTGRVYVHKDLNSLYKVVPKECLPSDYGGKQKPMSELIDDMRSFLVSMNTWYLNEGTQKSDESLRLENLNNDEILGFHGSFKKLEVD